MTEQGPHRPVIVGAGITGLTLADLWTRKGMDCVLIEKEDTPGGLARSIEIQGTPYDLGPHRFFTYDSEVLAYIEEALAGKLKRPALSADEV